MTVGKFVGYVNTQYHGVYRACNFQLERHLEVRCRCVAPSAESWDPWAEQDVVVL